MGKYGLNSDELRQINNFKKLISMKRIFFSLIAFLLLTANTNSQTINYWRGPDRDGKYTEKGLLKSWPETGPVMKWAYEGLGKGFTSPAMSDGKIYITGLEGENGFLHILSEDGQLIKKIQYGGDIFSPSGFPGPRSTPTVDGKLCYIVSGFGQLYCLDTESGKTVWTKGLFTDFDGSNIRFSFTENMIIDGEKLFVSPGGKKNNIVALNKKTGDLIWSAEGKGDLSAYCSPILVNHNGKKMLINMMGQNVVGLDANTGKLLWSHPYANQRGIHPNSPIYYKGSLYIFSGYAEGGQRINLNAEGTAATTVWTNKTVDPQLGGAILYNGYIYASGDRNRKWFCVDWETGEIKQESTELDKGTVIEAEDLLYVYTEKGELALLKPEAGGFKIISKTNIKLGSEQHWAHLVIRNATLYVRHGNALMAFDIKNK